MLLAFHWMMDRAGALLFSLVLFLIDHHRRQTLCLVPKCVPNQEYLCELVNLHVPGRSGLRSECDALKLVVHRYRLKRYGERSFLASAPVIWNALPLSLRSCTSLLSFRKNLKTCLFKKAFDLT